MRFRAPADGGEGERGGEGELGRESGARGVGGEERDRRETERRERETRREGEKQPDKHLQRVGERATCQTYVQISFSGNAGPAYHTSLIWVSVLADPPWIPTLHNNIDAYCIAGGRNNRNHVRVIQPGGPPQDHPLHLNLHPSGGRKYWYYRSGYPTRPLTLPPPPPLSTLLYS